MWYRSKITGKIVHSSCLNVLKRIWGDSVLDGSFSCFTILDIVEPTVIEVYRDTRSSKYAIIRYRELHKCSVREARDAVELLKKDISENRKRRHK